MADHGTQGHREGSHCPYPAPQGYLCLGVSSLLSCLFPSLFFLPPGTALDPRAPALHTRDPPSPAFLRVPVRLFIPPLPATHAGRSGLMNDRRPEKSPDGATSPSGFLCKGPRSPFCIPLNKPPKATHSLTVPRYVHGTHSQDKAGREHAGSVQAPGLGKEQIRWHFSFPHFPNTL